MGTIEKKTCEDYLSTKWSGGQTTELLVEPDSSSLAKRDFDFRLSTATVIMNTVKFSDFTGYQRILMSLDNPVRLGQLGSWISLNAFEPHHFDGKLKTTCQGECQDFNVIFKDDYDVFVQALKGNEMHFIKPQTIAVIYALENLSIVLLGDRTQRQMLQKNEMLVIKDETFIQVESSSSEKQNLANNRIAVLTKIKKQSRR